MLAEELRRRFRNMDSWHSTQEKRDTFRAFLQKISDSGYNLSTRKEVVKSAVRKHHQDLQTESDQGRPIYRTREEINKSKEAAKLINRPCVKEFRIKGTAHITENTNTPK